MTLALLGKQEISYFHAVPLELGVGSNVSRSFASSLISLLSYGEVHQDICQHWQVGHI